MKFSPPPTPPSPPPHQGGGGGVSDGNVSSGRRVSAPDRDEVHQPEHHLPENETKAAPAAVCCKTDGKRWKCRREAATGAYLCNHHLYQAKKSYTTSSKKPSTQRTQTKKASTVNKTSNPYEFYYYSGFGPRWAKRRGENSNHNNNVVNDGGGMDGVMEAANGGTDDEMERVAAPKNYSDFEEYDEEEWNRANSGKKRGRKPIKARSLKSLM